MGGTDRDDGLRRGPGPGATARAARAVEMLGRGSKPIYHLGVLVGLWRPTWSCFRQPERATPTMEGVAVVARYVGEDREVSLAALAALRAAAEALAIVADAPVRTVRAVPGVAEALARVLGAEDSLVRWAARRVRLAGAELGEVEGAVFVVGEDIAEPAGDELSGVGRGRDEPGVGDEGAVRVEGEEAGAVCEDQGVFVPSLDEDRGI